MQKGKEPVMKMAIRLGLVLGVVLLACSWTVGVSAQEVKEHPKQLQEILGLTETQVTAIRTERQAVEVRVHDLRVETQKLDEQIYQTAEDTGDPTAVGKLVLQKIALQKQIEGEEAGFRAQLSSILTPEQQDKFKILMEADHAFRGWEALLMGGELRVRHESRERGGIQRKPHPQK